MKLMRVPYNLNWRAGPIVVGFIQLSKFSREDPKLLTRNLRTSVGTTNVGRNEHDGNPVCPKVALSIGYPDETTLNIFSLTCLEVRT